MASDTVDKADVPSVEPPTSSGFFYGTLMAPEVFFTVCYRTSQPPAALASEYTFKPAVLPGYTRHRVRHEDYPGVVADSAKDAAVRGMLVSGLTAANLYHLDVFEGREYERRPVEVVVDGKPEQPVLAQVYVFKHAEALEPREWDFDEFRREKMHSWTRAEYTFDGCDPEQPASVVS